MTVPSCDLDTRRLREAIQAMYTRVVMEPESTFHFHRGAEYAAVYWATAPRRSATLPAEVTAAFSGIGNPLRIAPLRQRNDRG